MVEDRLGEFKCVSCGAGTASRVCAYGLSAPSHAKLFAGREIVRCMQCSLAQILPLPTSAELDAFYTHDYRAGGFNADPVTDRFPYDNPFKLSRGRAQRNLLAAQDVHLETASILEIGAGYGHNLVAYREKYPGCRVLAVECDPPALVGLRRAKIETIEGLWEMDAVESELKARAPFDVVVLSHVLEHPLEPVRLLQFVRSLLSAKGVVLIEVPNDYEYRLVRTPHSPHITFFDPPMLESFLARCGYDVRFCRSCGPRFVEPTSASAVVQRALHKAKWTLDRFVSPDRYESRRKRARLAEAEHIPLKDFAVYGDGRVHLRAIAIPAKGR